MKINVQKIISYTEPSEVNEENTKLDIESVEPGSETAPLYEYKSEYKEQVNEQNYPVGVTKKFNQKKLNLNFNFFKTKEAAIKYLDGLDEYAGYKIIYVKGPMPIDASNPDSTKVWKFKIEYPINPPLNLYNGIDLLYKDLFYGKLNNKNNVIKFKNDEKLLEQFNGTSFKAINFVHDAAVELLKQFNQQRKTHPKSILNNIEITKAYTKSIDYKNYLKILNQQFFNEVLDPIKNTKKISNFDNFLLLFHQWMKTKGGPVTESSFYKSFYNNIYATGLAFDVYEITSEEEKEQILNDPRYSNLYYLAKMNGFRIDPNYPTRLVADIKSEKMLDLYAKKYFEEQDIEKIPPLIYKNYFDLVEFSFSSKDSISLFLLNLINFYNNFVDKYLYSIDFTASADISQNYKKKFATNKVLRKKFDANDLVVERVDGNFTLNKKYLKTYVDFRLYEESINLPQKQYEHLIDKMMTLISVFDSKSFISTTNFSEKLLTSVQAINYLENFINSKKNPDSDKVDFAYVFGLAKEKLLTSGEDFSNLVQQDEEGNIFSVSPVDISTDFS